MAASFFRNIGEFKAKQSDVDNDASFLVSLESTIETVLYEYIEPWLGTALIDALKAAYLDYDNATAKQKVALGHLQAALAPLALHDWSLQGSLRTGNQGVVSPENRPFKYEKVEYRAKKLKDGKEALERLLLYLEANKSDFTAWDSDRHFERLLNTASAFRKAYSDNITRPTFDTLEGIINRVEHFYIEKQLPAAYFAALKTAFKSGSLTPKQKELIRLMRIAIANYTIDLAMQRGMVQIIDGNVATVSTDKDSGNWKTATGRDITFAGEAHRMWGNQDMARWRNYIITNKADFLSLFSTADGGTSTAADAWDLRPEEVKNPTTVSTDPPTPKGIIAL